jgi:16S rRNA (cytosine1402-N4)-methyltransferase
MVSAKRKRSTVPGEHRAVMLEQVLAILAPSPGGVVIDCTLGWAGHAVAFLERAGPTGKLVGIDLDPDNLPRAEERLRAVGHPFSLHQGNFAGLPAILARAGLDAAGVIFADLGMSSMQVDDPARGFSYRRCGPLDMRMDRTRGRTAAQILSTISQDDLSAALRELGDEPYAVGIAEAIVLARQRRPLQTTEQLAQLCLEATEESRGKGGWRLHPAPGRWSLHPAARTFQALRILVNRELDNLAELLRVLPGCLRPGGRVAILTFHSGEDRLVKAAFRQGRDQRVYAEIADEPVRPDENEKLENPRARSAKLRWARAVV